MSQLAWPQKTTHTSICFVGSSRISRKSPFGSKIYSSLRSSMDKDSHFSHGKGVFLISKPALKPPRGKYSIFESITNGRNIIPLFMNSKEINTVEIADKSVSCFQRQRNNARPKKDVRVPGMSFGQLISYVNSVNVTSKTMFRP